MIITIDQIIAARGCYSDARVFEISAGRTEITLTEICDLPIPELDRVFLASQFLTDRHERHLRCDYAQAVAHISTDPRVHRAIDTARRYADGNATDDELLAAERASWEAACAAARASAAWAAAAARAADESQTIDIIGILRERIETQEAE